MTISMLKGLSRLSFVTLTGFILLNPHSIGEHNTAERIAERRSLLARRRLPSSACHLRLGGCRLAAPWADKPLFVLLQNSMKCLKRGL